MAEVILEVALEGLEFFGYHGYYEEEGEKGNWFKVDVKTTSLLQDPSLLDRDELGNTVNYEVLYSIVQQEMENRVKLLETVAYRILERVKCYPHVENIEISVTKLNPPVGGDCKSAKVTLKTKA
ncbi:MAG TPA: dihydroneopterin aldolase [Cytophagaceae bacterium]|jgi:dihydroneopterin aldolase